MNRRDLIALAGGVAAWPMAARAQGERMRRVGVLTPMVEGDRESQRRLAAFREGLQQLGWVDGRDFRIDARWGAGDDNRLRGYAAELVALAPDIVLVHGSPALVAIQRANPSFPIVFANVVDPVSAGFVESMARPGGTATGFTVFEYGLSGKWLELLKELAPRVKRVAILRDVAIAAGSGQLGALQTAASTFGIELRPVGVRDDTEIERSLAAFASGANGGLIVTGSTLALNHRKLIVALAARHMLPAVYPYRYFVSVGGLVCYGPDPIDSYRRAAGYVDRIL
jgi:putative ABC transport system substrate-binding protein